MCRHGARLTETSRIDSPGRESSVVIWIGLAVALSLFGDMAMYVILPVHFADLGLSALQVGILLSANRWIRLLTNRVAEQLLSRYNARLIFPVILVCGSVIAAAYAVAPGFAALLGLRIAWGICWSFIRHTGTMTSVTVAGENRTGRHMGLFVGLVQVGFILGTLLAGFLFDSFGFRVSFLLAAVVSLSALPAAIIGQRRAPRRLLEKPSSAASGNAGMVLLWVRGFLVSFVGPGLIMSTLGFLIRSRFGDSVSVGALVIGVTTMNGLLLATQYLINAAGSPAFGVLIDRFGTLRLQVIGFLAAGVALIVVVVVNGALLVALVVVFFAGAAIARLAVESQGAAGGPRAYANLATSTDLGSAAGPVLGWVGIELAQSNVVFWGGGALFVVAGLVAVVSSRR